MATTTMTRLFIAGAWEDGPGQTAEATSPATGESLGVVAQADRETAGRAVAAAQPGKAPAAAAMARRASSRSPCATKPSDSPVAGLNASTVPPPVSACQAPPM